MSRKKYNNKEVATIIELEGLDYAIQSYLSPSDIKDKKLAAFWQQAFDALNAIEAYLEPHIEEE